MRSSGARFVGGLVRGYQVVVRPLLPSACRFQPSCSEYYRQALMSVGLLRATWLAACRIGRCHPWHEGGYDPPPGARFRSFEKPGA
jgi:putative membrane protein insertion efficiency factor